MKKQYPIDVLFFTIRSKLLSDANVDISQEKKQLKFLLETSLHGTKRADLIQALRNFNLDGKKVLDYGCGGGQTVVYLRLLGIDVYGVCVDNSRERELLQKSLDFPVDTFATYDGKVLPYSNQQFDLIFSEQVLEHVHDLDSFYKESSRVLKNDGLCYHVFPQRSIPYDTHMKKWFIHYFPTILRNMLYSLFSVDPKRANYVLNFKWTYQHLKIAKKYFTNIKNITAERLCHQAANPNINYKSDLKLRYLIDSALLMPVLGKFFARALSQFSNINLLIKK